MRRGLVPILAVFAVGALLVYGSLKGPASPARVDASSTPDLAPGIVDTVSDGDTIHLADGRRVRLVQIDAPEISDDECYAKEAARVLERLVPLSSTVFLRADRALDKRDRFGRTLAYVFEQKTNINLRLVELGAAAPYFYRGDRGRYADELMTSAREARAKKRGLWGACPGTQLDPGRQVETGP